MTDVIEIIKPDAKPSVGNSPTVVEENVNLELLNKTMEYIEAHPQTWYQANWFVVQDGNGELVPHLVEIKVEEVNSCGTAMCFAGHAALMEGFPAPPKDSWFNWDRKVEGYNYPESVSEFATKRLGLKVEQANELFDASNTLEILREMVNAINEDPTISHYLLQDIRERALDEAWNEDEDDDEEETW